VDPAGVPYALTQISAGRYHTCGVRTNGAGVCWGRNDYYQAEVPASVPVGNIVRDIGNLHSVSTGTYHTCATRSSDNRGLCWGYNAYGQSLFPKYAINLPYDAETLKMISAGEAHACGIREAGHVFCWGWNHYKQADPVPSHAAKLIGTGDFHSCSVSDTGEMKCWGWNNFGQCAIPAALGTVETGNC